MEVPSFLDLADAQTRLIDEVTATSDQESVSLKAALGRVAAADIAASIDIPHFDNSAMDGYAVLHDDPAFNSDNPRLAVIGESFAGRPYAGNVSAGQCVRIFTGARIPEGATAVVMQEDAIVLDEGQVRPRDAQRVGAVLGERARTGRPGEHSRQVEHADPLERAVSAGERLGIGIADAQDLNRWQLG